MKISLAGKNNFSQLRVTTIEGRNHFVKDMFGTLGYKVMALNRISYAGIRADINKGEYRKLTSEEIKVIKDKYGH
jgi:16S rRNA U516 pseudouridylate synthase RsuA-like enzyme